MKAADRHIGCSLQEPSRTHVVAPLPRPVGASDQALGRSSAERPHVIIRLAELDPESMSLLEVVSEDLLVLVHPLTRGALEPLCVPLVKVGSLFLRHRLVCRVADQQVPEPECVLTRELRPVGTDQLLPRESEEP